MKRFFSKTLLSFLPLIISPNFARAQEMPDSTGQFGAPYFVDGVHCEGLPLKKLWPLAGETSARASKQVSQNYCEGLFRMYGIEKFNWYTPEQIEFFQHAIRRSNDFEVQDLSLKKSTQQGHVHLLVKLQLKTENQYDVNFIHETFDSKGNESSGQADGVSVGISIPEEERPMVWKINATHYDFRANSPLKEDSLWSDQEKSLNSSPSFFFNKIDVGAKNLFPESFMDLSIDIGFLQHNATENRNLGVDSNVTFNMLHRMAAESSGTSVGLIFDSQTARPFEIGDQSQSIDTNRVGLFFGLDMGDIERQFLSLQLRALAPNGSGDSGLLATNLKMGFAMERWADQFYLKMDSISGIDNKNLDLGLKRRLASNGRELDIEMGLNKRFSLINGNLRLTPFAGIVSAEHALANTKAINKYQSTADVGKAGLRVTWETAGYDISGTLTYFDSRVR
jgi:hypothetical protein